MQETATSLLDFLVTALCDSSFWHFPRQREVGAWNNKVCDRILNQMNARQKASEATGTAPEAVLFGSIQIINGAVCI